MKSIHFTLQSVLLIINMFLFLSPVLGFFCATITGCIQMFHSLFLLITIPLKKIKIGLAIHLSIATIYLTLFSLEIFHQYVLIGIPTLLAFYFWFITFHIRKAVKQNLEQNELDDFLTTNDEK
jgi:hypothetical protein